MRVIDKNLTEALSKDLEDGPLIAAVYARIDTALGVARFFTPLGNYLVARPAARAKARGVTEKTDVPLDAGMVLGATKDALHIWSADIMLNQVRDHLGSVPRDRIADVEVGVGRGWQPLALVLSDGARIDVEARGGVHQFVTTFA